MYPVLWAGALTPQGKRTAAVVIHWVPLNGIGAHTRQHAPSSPVRQNIFSNDKAGTHYASTQPVSTWATKGLEPGLSSLPAATFLYYQTSLKAGFSCNSEAQKQVPEELSMAKSIQTFPKKKKKKIFKSSHYLVCWELPTTVWSNLFSLPNSSQRELPMQLVPLLPTPSLLQGQFVLSKYSGHMAFYWSKVN